MLQSVLEGVCPVVGASGGRAGCRAERMHDGMGYVSMLECVASAYRVLGSIPSTVSRGGASPTLVIFLVYVALCPAKAIACLLLQAPGVRLSLYRGRDNGWRGMGREKKAGLRPSRLPGSWLYRLLVS